MPANDGDGQRFEHCGALRQFRSEREHAGDGGQGRSWRWARTTARPKAWIMASSAEKPRLAPEADDGTLERKDAVLGDNADDHDSCPCGSDIEGRFGIQRRARKPQSWRATRRLRMAVGAEKVRNRKAAQQKGAAAPKIIPPAYRWTISVLRIQAAVFRYGWKKVKCKFGDCFLDRSDAWCRDPHLRSARDLHQTLQIFATDSVWPGSMVRVARERSVAVRPVELVSRALLMLSSEERFCSGKRTRYGVRAIIENHRGCGKVRPPEPRRR